jgi:multicomponent Na+:H+ antiporter subunit D
MHITIHAFGKITLFFVAGAIYVRTHKKNVSELNGIGRQMPFTMAAFTVGSFSMIAVPPFGGFISKWYLLMGTFEAHLLPILVVIVASTLLNAAYFLPIVYAAFFKKPDSGEVHGIKEAPALMVVPILITAASVLILFFASPLLLNLVKIAVASALGGSY